VSVTGDDPEGETVRRLLQQIGINAAAVLVADDRPTTLKQRLLGRTHAKHAQQMIRVDREQSQPIRAELAQCLIAAVEEMLATVELVLLSDYDKGVCAGSFIPRVVEAARAAGVPVVADPVRGTDYHRYAGCTCVTPNRSEAAGALGMTIATPEDGLEAARQMLRFGVESAMVTLDRDGIAWADAKDNARWFPVCPRQVYDITGAGDMVLSALGYALAAGADWPTAVELANLAGGLEVERLGVVPISRTELLAELSGDLPDAARKILSVDELLDQLGRHRQAGRAQLVLDVLADRGDDRVACNRKLGALDGLGRAARRVFGNAQHIVAHADSANLSRLVDNFQRADQVHDANALFLCLEHFLRD